MGIVFGKITVECAAHDVLRQLEPNAQLRRYHPSVMAETPCSGGGVNSKDRGDAFKRLANYIGVFGEPKNEGKNSIPMTAPVVSSGEKISMTAPVINTSGGGGGEQASETPGTMSFVLPSKYKAVDQAPKPADPLVTLRQVPERDAAVLTFYGTASDSAVNKRAAELAAVLKKEGIPPLHPAPSEKGVPEYEVLRYNPPFTLPFLRTNEILIEVPRQ